MDTMDPMDPMDLMDTMDSLNTMDPMDQMDTKDQKDTSKMNGQLSENIRFIIIENQIQLRNKIYLNSLNQPRAQSLMNKKIRDNSMPIPQ